MQNLMQTFHRISKGIKKMHQNIYMKIYIMKNLIPERKIGLSSARALAKASSPHGYQSTCKQQHATQDTECQSLFDIKN